MNAYYQNETTRILPAGKKEIVSRTILALEVNDDGTIVKKKLLDLKDGIKVKKALGKTETAGSDYTFFQQICFRPPSHLKNLLFPLLPRRENFKI